jgi:Ran GTPase-activating protein (RanGAP) involved in mRNA processing and transport
LVREIPNDAGVTALADACGRGALAMCKELDLNGNQIGDAGVESLADACAIGALSQCTELDLSVNQIGDAGIAALARPIKPVSEGGSGAMANLKELYFDRGNISGPVKSAIKDICKHGCSRA